MAGLAPGWYPDPASADTRRYWDGVQWTEHLASAASPQVYATGSSSDKPVHVTFVHGTWGSRAKWPRAGSPMWEAFEAEGAHCHWFTWSGRNSHRARMRAADRLAQHFRRLEVASDGAPQAVVAHSHGGNAALHAVWRLRAAGEMQIRVVTLATPYFFAKRRRSVSPPDPTGSVLDMLRRAFGKARATFAPVVSGFGATGLLVLGWALALVYLLADDRSSFSWSVHVLFYPLVVALVVRSLGWAYFRVAHGGWKKQGVQMRLIAGIQTPEIPETEKLNVLLVIRAADDEAGGVLGSAQFSGWVGLTVARLSKPGPIIGLFLVGLIAGLSIEDTSTDQEYSWGVEFLLDTSFPTFMVLLVVMGIPAISSLAHGWDGPTTSEFAIVTAEASPPGNSTVWQREIRDASAGGLAHSSLYDDPMVICRVVRHALNLETPTDPIEARSLPVWDEPPVVPKGARIMRLGLIVFSSTFLGGVSALSVSVATGYEPSSDVLGVAMVVSFFGGVFGGLAMVAAGAMVWLLGIRRPSDRTVACPKDPIEAQGTDGP